MGDQAHVPQHYLWCILPDVQDDMEGCPDDESLLVVYMTLSSLVGLFVFLFAQAILAIRKKNKDNEKAKLKEQMMDEDFAELQISLYGEKALRRLNHMSSTMHSKSSLKDGA